MNQLATPPEAYVLGWTFALFTLYAMLALSWWVIA